MQFTRAASTPADSPDSFVDETPTAVMGQILGAVAQFEKAALLAKLKNPKLPSGNRPGRKPFLRRLRGKTPGAHAHAEVWVTAFHVRKAIASHFQGG